jgi:hypothetical protein
MKKKPSFIYRNSLSIVLLLMFIAFLGAQAVTGWKEYNKDRADDHALPLPFRKYLISGHFIETTFENWESEFLQMGAYVVLTIFLRQKGSSESKSIEEPEEVDREPDPKRKGAPWAVRKGGYILRLYKHSLTLALLILFLISLSLHAWGSFRHYNEEQAMQNKRRVHFREFLGESRFWFESFQNWQSEFIAVSSLVILSIFLRQQGSPQSKPVDAPDDETGE